MKDVEKVRVTMENSINSGIVKSMKIDGRKVPDWLVKKMNEGGISVKQNRGDLDMGNTVNLVFDFDLSVEHLQIVVPQPKVEPEKPKTFLELFKQDYWWRSKDGWVRVEDVDLQYALNIMSYIDHRSKTYATKVAWGLMNRSPEASIPLGEMSDGVFASAMHFDAEVMKWTITPLEMIRKSKLYQAIKRRASIANTSATLR